MTQLPRMTMSLFLLFSACSGGAEFTLAAEQPVKNNDLGKGLTDSSVGGSNGTGGQMSSGGTAPHIDTVIVAETGGSLSTGGATSLSGGQAGTGGSLSTGGTSQCPQGSQGCQCRTTSSRCDGTLTCDTTYNHCCTATSCDVPGPTGDATGGSAATGGSPATGGNAATGGAAAKLGLGAVCTNDLQCQAEALCIPQVVGTHNGQSLCCASAQGSYVLCG